ncbi:MAG: TIR domain-containing protein [Clostridiales Family XIII bacterium]|jgi:tetratricopeptide (TPR) repeat protein|nr:TIR domain-containing protein [Clostridiales Family XIII bacterium]
MGEKLSEGISNLKHKEEAWTYDAFISYRHKELDSKVAGAALSFLESYSLPKQLSQSGITGIERVFRDTEELAVSRILSDTIVEALENTRFLVVICSTDLPDSSWCDKEVASFIELGRSQNVYALLVNGDRENSFLPSLKKIPDIGDRLLDARVEGVDPSDKTNYEKKLISNVKRELMRVVSDKADCPFEVLTALDTQRRHRNTAVRFTASAVSFAIFLAVAAGLWLGASSFRDTAQSEQAASMDMLYALTYTLPEDLAEISGTGRLISDTLRQNVADIDAILSMAKNPDLVALQKAENLMKLAGVYNTLGDTESAISSDREAVSLLKPAFETGGGKETFSYAKSLTALGSRLSESGSFDEAKTVLTEAVSVQRSDSTAAGAALNLAACYQNQAANLSRMGQYDEAIEILLFCAEYLKALPDFDSQAVQRSYMSTSQNLGTDFAMLAQYEDAANWIAKQVDTAEALYEDNPTRTNLSALAAACASFANTANLAGEKANADAYFARAIGYFKTLASDRDNVAAAEALATAYANYGASLNVSGDYEGAAKYYDDALEIRDKSAKSSDDAQTALIARLYYNIAENYLDMDDLAKARKAYDACLEKYEPVSEALGDYHRSEYLARLSYYDLIFLRNPTEAQSVAEEAVAKMPDSSFAHYMLAYAMLYNEDARAVSEFELLTSRGQNERDNIREDLAMQTRIGLTSSITATINVSLDFSK